MSESVQQAMQAAWQPINTAPRGSYRPVTTTVRGVEHVKQVFEPDWVWTCRTSDGYVTKSYYLPDLGRWNLYSADAGPDFWQPIVTPLVKEMLP